MACSQVRGPATRRQDSIVPRPVTPCFASSTQAEAPQGRTPPPGHGPRCRAGHTRRPAWPGKLASIGRVMLDATVLASWIEVHANTATAIFTAVLALVGVAGIFTSIIQARGSAAMARATFPELDVTAETPDPGAEVVKGKVSHVAGIFPARDVSVWVLGSDKRYRHTFRRQMVAGEEWSFDAGEWTGGFTLRNRPKHPSRFRGFPGKEKGPTDSYFVGVCWTAPNTRRQKVGYKKGPGAAVGRTIRR